MPAAIAEELSAVISGFQKNAPESAKGPLNAARADIMATFDRSSAIREGQPLPEFELSDALGKKVSSRDLLSKGALLYVFPLK